MKPTVNDQRILADLEQSLWDKNLHFDSDEQNYTISAKFVEVDRSGQRHERTSEFVAEKRAQLTEVKSPLADYSVELVGEDMAMVTYVCEVRFGGTLEVLHCVSLWAKVGSLWQLQLHQTTPR
ncbi:DUF4440 domain-containing protein [Roseovarius sp. THAF8]|uniref:DUF4440 domain-containing protein n=1 Tax=Roseovarius sp. THAF8 TaxID=2587846 RepID=UPI0015626C50|nr:DUF4440 domain-containing protein [Roseovarius sp. THAF8]